MTTSLVDPRDDFDDQPRAARSTCSRRCAGAATRPPLVFASTNKVYGDLADIALDATDDAYVPRDPALRAHGHRRGAAARFPHALWLLEGRGRPVRARLRPQLRRADRGPADELHLRPAPDGHRGPGLGRAFPDPRARRASRSRIYGDGRQVRDILDVDDAVDAYVAAWRRIDARRGPRLQPRRRPGQRRQPAPAHRPHRGRWSAARSSSPSPTGAPATSATYVVRHAPRRARARAGEPRPWRDGVAALARWLRERGSRATDGAAAGAAERRALAERGFAAGRKRGGRLMNAPPSC